MNIFILDNDPKENARYHVDKHASKMILEHAQMMCTAYRMSNGVLAKTITKTGKVKKHYILPNMGEYDGMPADDRCFIYWDSYINHPCTKWVRESIDNFYYLYDLTFYLNLEYRYRFNHNYNHLSFDVVDNLPEPNICNIGLTPFAQAMPDEYKNENAVIAYRRYYVFEKSHLFSWSKLIGEDEEGNLIREKLPKPEWLDYYGSL